MNWAFHGIPILTRQAEFFIYETIFGPKMSYFSPFLLPKDHIQEKFHHYFYHFFIKHQPSVFQVKFKIFLPYVTQINSENIKNSNLLRKMHYSGPDSPAFSQVNKKSNMTSLPPNSNCSYTTQVQPTACTFHIQQCDQISFHNNPNLLQGLLYFNIFTVDTWAESKTPDRNLIRNRI